MFNRQQVHSRNKTSISLALACALGLHLLILLVPISRHSPPADNQPAMLELQLTTVPAPAPEPVETQDQIVVEETVPEEIIPDPAKVIAESISEPPPAEPAEVDLEPIIDQKRRRLSRSILSARLLPEESEADKIFGRPLEIPNQPNYAEFSRPIGQNMITMLEQPMPELPFAYTPGLVHFSYDPGVRGELQRFWDVITPEFGWRTDNGTEFKCIMVLVIFACGWK